MHTYCNVCDKFCKQSYCNYTAYNLQYRVSVSFWYISKMMNKTLKVENKAFFCFFVPKGFTMAWKQISLSKGLNMAEKWGSGAETHLSSHTLQRRMPTGALYSRHTDFCRFLWQQKHNNDYGSHITQFITFLWQTAETNWTHQPNTNITHFPYSRRWQYKMDLNVLQAAAVVVRLSSVFRDVYYFSLFHPNKRLPEAQI